MRTDAGTDRDGLLPPGRETFADAQDRHRRAGRRLSAACVAAVAVVGAPLGVVVSPLAIALVVILADLVNLVVPFPDLGALAAHTVLGLGDVTTSDWLAVRMVQGLIGGLVLVLPGILLTLGLWLAVRRLLVRAGAEALVRAAGARPPGSDPAERRLVNLVEEMAIAAGVPAPRVMVLDADVANAAVVGRSVEDATIVVPRRLLDDLGRGPTGAVVANLLAPVIAGDLRLALHVASVLQAFDLVGAVLAAPGNERTRRALWRLLRLSLRRHPTDGDADEASFIADELALLGRGASPARHASGLLGGLAQLPFLVASWTFTLTRLGPGALLVDPALGALWRRRRLLADATAVQLTRDPGAMARALAHLDARGARVPEGPWAHLFLVAPSAVMAPPAPDDDATGSPDDAGAYEQDVAREAGPDEPAWARLDAALAARPTLVQRARRAGVAWGSRAAAGRWSGAPTVAAGSATAELASFVPPLDDRLRRLNAMGARPDLDPGVPVAPPERRGARLGRALRAAVTWPARLVTAAGLLAVTLALAYVTLVIDALVLAPIVTLVHLLLR